MHRRALLASPLVAAPALIAGRAVAQGGGQPRIVTEEHMVPSGDAGIELFVRNKRPETLNTFSPGRTLLMVHGATYPAHTAFDLPLGGLSWMDYIAGRGFDVWCVDVRGYGRSTRPPEMAQPANANPPLVRGDMAVRDIAAVHGEHLAAAAGERGRQAAGDPGRGNARHVDGAQPGRVVPGGAGVPGGSHRLTHPDIVYGVFIRLRQDAEVGSDPRPRLAGCTGHSPHGPHP